MWDPRRLTTLWASTTCYRNIFTFLNILWNIKQCRPFKVNRRFGGTYRIHTWFHAGFRFARLILRPWRWRRYIFPKRQLTFDELRGVISQKLVLLSDKFASSALPRQLHAMFQPRVFINWMTFPECDQWNPSNCPANKKVVDLSEIRYL
jgi:hypothetical protein